MNFKHILIVTYGRTGSTLLMGLLNSIEGVLIRGENLNLCLGLFDAYHSLVKTKENHGISPTDDTVPFFGASYFDESKFLTDAQNLLFNQLNPDNSSYECLGFKEIRYIPSSLTSRSGSYELSQYLDFLEKLMPQSAFIFLTRNHEDVSTSEFWKNKAQTHAFDEMQKFENVGKNWSKKRNNCFWIDYSELILKEKKLKALFTFLAADFDAEKIDSVMSKEHSYGGKLTNLPNVELKPRSIKITKKDIPETVFIALDSIPKNIKNNHPFTASGVVLFNNNKNTEVLVKNNASSKQEIKTGIATPWYKDKFPDYEGSEFARFSISELSFEDDQPIEILFLNGGKEYTGFYLSLV